MNLARMEWIEVGVENDDAVADDQQAMNAGMLLRDLVNHAGKASGSIYFAHDVEFYTRAGHDECPTRAFFGA